MKIINQHFQDLQELARFVRDTPRCKGASDSSHQPANEWTGNMSRDETLDLCINNAGFWEPGARAIHDLSLTLPSAATPNMSNTRRPKRHYAGSRPHVPAAIASAPKSMLNPTRQPKFKPVLKIAVALTGSAMVDQSEFYNRGAAILSAVRELERQGNKVQLDGIMCVRGSDNPNLEYRSIMTIKQAGDKLSPADLSFILTHCGVTRRLFMGLAERHPELKRETTHGSYGRPGSIDKLPGYDVRLPSPKNGYRTPQDADRTIQDEINTQLTQNSKSAA